MAGAISKGDWVEAIKTQRGNGCWIYAKSLYQVAVIYPPEPGAFCTDCDTDQTDGVGLEGQPHGGGLGCWCICGFKPIYRPKSELFDHHLTKASAPELVDA